MPRSPIRGQDRTRIRMKWAVKEDFTPSLHVWLVAHSLLVGKFILLWFEG